MGRNITFLEKLEKLAADARDMGDANFSEFVVKRNSYEEIQSISFRRGSHVFTLELVSWKEIRINGGVFDLEKDEDRKMIKDLVRYLLRGD